MLYLASSSKMRANLLKNAKISFTQIFLNYDESMIDRHLSPEIYVQRLLFLKEAQFYNELRKNKQNPCFKGFCENEDSVLFADSVVSVPGFKAGRVLGKSTDKNEALQILRAQSGKSAIIYSAFLLNAPKFKITSLARTKLEFSEFSEVKMLEFIESESFLNKAGCIACEGFHAEFITKQIGSFEAALGLDIPTLKA